MGVPATTGQLRTKIEDMKIGDYISCIYTYHATSGVLNSNALDILYGIGNTTEATTRGEKPLTGESTSASGKAFYFVKVAKGLLVADRVCQHTITWDTLNTGRIIQGKSYSFTINPSVQGGSSSINVSGVVRSLTGGVAFADVNGNSSTTDLGFGAFPTNSEFDKYIMKFDTKLIQSGKTLDDVFHHIAVKTWTQDTPALSIGANTNRVTRGGSGTATFRQIVSTTSNATIGFRPCFEWNEA